MHVQTPGKRARGPKEETPNKTSKVGGKENVGEGGGGAAPPPPVTAKSTAKLFQKLKQLQPRYALCTSRTARVQRDINNDPTWDWAKDGNALKDLKAIEIRMASWVEQNEWWGHWAKVVNFSDYCKKAFK